MEILVSLLAALPLVEASSNILHGIRDEDTTIEHVPQYYRFNQQFNLNLDFREGHPNFKQKHF